MFLFSLDGMVVFHRLFYCPPSLPSNKSRCPDIFSSTQLYSWVERSTKKAQGNDLGQYSDPNISVQSIFQWTLAHCNSHRLPNALTILPFLPIGYSTCTRIHEHAIRCSTRAAWNCPISSTASVYTLCPGFSIQWGLWSSLGSQDFGWFGYC